MALSRAVLVCGVVIGSAALAGCNGNVRSQERSQTVRPDGTAVQTQVRERETSGGAVVRETQTQERQVIKPGEQGESDATKSDAKQ